MMLASMDVDESPSRMLELFNRHPIYDNILSRLTPLSLTHMASVSSDIRKVTKDFSTRAYNINKRLSRFVSDAIAFRSLMARTHMVISGSFALQYFDRTYYPHSDLDLYIHPDDSMTSVGSYLVADGYRYKPLSWQLAKFEKETERILANIDALANIGSEEETQLVYSLRSLRTIFNFEKELEGGDVLKVQLLVSRISPLASVLDFHSTCVMNIITYHAAYSLYPYATFERRDTLVVNQDTKTEAALAKYSARGWRILHCPSPDPCLEFLRSLEKGHPLHDPLFFINTARWVSDRLSWVIPLDMNGVSLPPPLSTSQEHPGWDPIAECGWLLDAMAVYRSPTETWTYTQSIEYETVKSTILRWRYTAPSLFYHQSIIPFLCSQETMEHSKIPPGKTKDDVLDVWTWCDHMLPTLRQSFSVKDGHRHLYLEHTKFTAALRRALLSE